MHRKRRPRLRTPTSHLTVCMNFDVFRLVSENCCDLASTYSSDDLLGAICGDVVSENAVLAGAQS